MTPQEQKLVREIIQEALQKIEFTKKVAAACGYQNMPGHLSSIELDCEKALLFLKPDEEKKVKKGPIIDATGPGEKARIIPNK